MAQHGKRYTESAKKVEADRLYTPLEAARLLRSMPRTRFDETVEVHIRMGIDTRHADQQIRGSISLPHGTGKSVRVAVFAEGEKAKEAEAAGADVVGSDELVEKIQGGFTDFDATVATPDQMSKAGLAWHIFPNMAVLQGVTFALCYRARPYGDDPNKCIFESYAIERFPEGEEPKTEWVYGEPTKEKWGLVLSQDFSNMAAVQRGMRSRGFRGTLPNPHQEQKITNFHRNLAQYMGTGSPRLLSDKE